MRAGFFYHLTEHFRILQHGAGTQMVVIKGLTIVICHENGGFQRFQQGHIPDVGVGIVDEHAGIYIAVCIDVEIPPTACNAAAYKFAVILICTNLTQIISIVNCFYFQKNDCLQETAIFYNQSYYRRKPSRIFCSASSAVRPRVMSLRICSPAILPMAAS